MKTNIPVYDICQLSANIQDEILVSRFADYLKSHTNLYFPHRHSFYHLVLITQGAGSQSIDFEHFKVRPMQIYFMIPGQVHTWSFDGPTDGYIINFSVPYFQSFLAKPDYLENFSFFNGVPAEAVIQIPDELQNKIKDLFEQIVYENEHHHQQSDDLTRALMLQLFIQIDRLTNRQELKSTIPYNYTLLRNFQKLIDKHYQTLKLPKDYAELLYITPNHLNALCKDILGIPAGEVIRNRIILEAKRLLVNLNLSVSEIAYQLNFADNSYFTKFFKKQANTTPEEFRKNNLNQ